LARFVVDYYREYVVMMCTRIIRSAPLFGCIIWLGIRPALAQANQERVQIIMSKLPPQTSATYKAIKRLVGKPTGQPLPLTKCEMWSVPKENFEVVKKAVAQHGVTVMQLDADWGQVFHKALADRST
jgi:hypothetical protein